MRLPLLCIVVCAMELCAQVRQVPPTVSPTPLSSPPTSQKTSKLQPAFRISGVVLDATSGQSLPGARVSLGTTAGNRGGPDRSVLTGPDGSFAFEHLAADKYQIFGEAVGYPLQGFEQHEAPFLTGVVVGPDIAADHLIFKLQRGCVISGTVTDEYNEPVREAQVMLFHRGLENGRFASHFSNQVQTDDQGYYKFASLLPGTHFVAVSARPWFAHSTLALTAETEAIASSETIDDMKRLDIAYPLTFYSGATDASRATEITLRHGDRITADVVLHSTPAASVRVRSSSSQQPGTQQARQQWSLTLMQHLFEDFDMPVQFEQRSAGEDSLYTGLAPGHYLAHINGPGIEGDRVQEVDVSGETTIDPEAIVAPGSCSVKGLVKMSGEQTLPRDAIILLRNYHGNSQGRRIEEKGEFSFDQLQPGTYEVSVANAPDVYLLDMAVTNARVTGRSVTLVGASAAELAIVLGKGVGEIRGVAVRDGKGLGGTMVLLVPENAGSSYVLFRRDQSDSDGTFFLQQVVPGKYSVVSIQEGWDLEWSKAEVLKPFLQKAEKIEVKSGGKYNIKVQVQDSKVPRS